MTERTKAKRRLDREWHRVIHMLGGGYPAGNAQLAKLRTAAMAFGRVVERARARRERGGAR